MPIQDSRETNDRGEPVEKQRVCPSCRMLISVLASKCRYCGEEVGKPKDETRELTTSDLGGETIYHRAPSGSVMDALEAFRLEETSTLQPPPEPPKPRSFLRRKAAEPAPPPKKDDLPDLDEQSMALAEAVLSPSSINRTSAISRYDRTPREKAILSGAWLLGLAILLFAGIRGFGWYQDYRAEQAAANVVVVENRAPALMARGAEPIDILAAAVDALRQDGSGENKRIAEEALALVEVQIRDLLNPERKSPSEPWSLDKISQALTLADRASTIYPNEVTSRLRRETAEESAYYRMTLSAVTEGSALFRLTYPSPRSVTVKTGETLDDRFRVRNVVGSEAKLQDLRRMDRASRPREITFRVGSVRPF